MHNCEIACQRMSFTNEEKLQYENLREKIFISLLRIEELELGYSFVLKQESHLLHNLADWIPLEQKCCPFLQFTLTFIEGGQLRLNLIGPSEVKTFLLHELNLV
ncbi:hypothetical protein [Paenibacillus sp. GP183]|uniref:hypothetical protein n=1 Tax=Paenibacillus sp. GP183 TaxID=1882751 RepID=UPI000895933B|nr:hypothetical protein [Paenibacillus sp. GP183]SEC54823.1 hypothetical protein SAMN05443246_4471 [Paenibacillus sp. GP183]